MSDINDLRAQQEDLLYQQQQASKKDKSEDPVAIRQALKYVRFYSLAVNHGSLSTARDL